MFKFKCRQCENEHNAMSIINQQIHKSAVHFLKSVTYVDNNPKLYIVKWYKPNPKIK